MSGNSPSTPLLGLPGCRKAELILRVVAAITLMTNAAYVASIVVPRPDSGYLTLWDGWLFHLATTLPAVLTAFRAFHVRHASGAWWCVTAGILLNTAGNLVYTYHDQNLTPIPFPAWSDAPLLASYAMFAIAVVTLTQGDTAQVSKAARLDGLVIGLAAGAVAVAIWFESILSDIGSSAAAVVGLSYPLLDVALIVTVIAGLASTRCRPTWSTGIFTIGVAAFAIGDVAYLNQLAHDTYRPNTPLEWTWLIGIAAFGAAAWAPVTRRRPIPTSTSRVQGLVPILAAGISLIIVSLGLYDRFSRFASWLAIAAIGAALGRLALSVRELRASEAFGQARTDELTGLLNRRGFAQDLDALLARQVDGISILMVDLNAFKEVNDSLGHHIGDQLLTVVAARFANALPKDALIGRLGGDEFGIALVGSPTECDNTVTALLGKLDDPISIDGISIRVGASIGVAQAPDHGETRDELLRAADVAMYDAKTNQLGCVVYSSERDPHNRDRLGLIEDLRNAIDRRSFEMHYQPSIDVLSGSVVGMEALIRWNHPSHGLMGPDDFIPLAERVGLIPAITSAVLDLSIAYLAETRRNGHELGLSVNISALDLVNDDLTRYVATTLNAYGVPAHRLTLEITETALSADSFRAVRTLDALRREGIRISIDDFGVGYSSMSQLLKLPVDELKIDRSFIANLNEDVRAQAVLSAIVQLGRTLGLAVVAEGIETRTALDEVARRGVETAQGYYFSKPLPAQAFEAFLTSSNQAAKGPSDSAVGLLDSGDTMVPPGQGRTEMRAR